MNRIINYLQSTFLIIKMEIKSIYQYRFNFLSQILFLPLKIICIIILWTTLFEKNNDIVNNYTLETMILYYVFLTIIEFGINPLCAITYQMSESIRTGTIDIHLIKPVSYLRVNYFNKFSCLILGSAISIVAITYFCFSTNSFNILSILLFFIAFLFGSIILYLFFSIIGVLAFKFENVLTLRDNIWNIIKLFSGALIPLNFYPNILRTISNYLPFKYIYSFPIELIINNIDYNNYTNLFLIDIFWIIFLYIIYRILWIKFSRLNKSNI